MQQKKISDDDLIRSYKQNGALSKIAAEFNVPDVTIWRRCQKLGLTFQSGGVRKKVPLSEILEGKHPQYQSNKLKKKLLQEGVFENVCSECGISDWKGVHLVMQLDHIDGNTKNHVKDNLRMLCPNCHSQTDTWCGKNKPPIKEVP